ncbi:MAG: hypothetical protein AAGF11_20910 [Myxococcota bacterium]
MGRYQPNAYLPPKRYRPPPSGVLLGAVVDGFGLRDPDEPVLSSKTAQRFFHGERISENKRNELLDAIALALVEVGFRLPFVTRSDDTNEVAPIRQLLDLHARAWDQLCGLLSSQACPIGITEGPWIIFAYLRLAVIDLAIRWTAVRLLNGAPVPTDEDWSWARPRGGQELLVGWLADPRVAMTPEKLARELGMNRNTVYGWTGGGSTPDLASLAAIADFFAGRLECDRDELARQLRMHYGLVALARRVRVALELTVVPKKERGRFFQFLSDGLSRFVRQGCEELEPYTRPSVIERPGAPTQQDLGELLQYGSRGGGAARLLARWWEEERNLLWATDLRAICRPWLDRIQQCARQISLMSDPSAIKELKRELARKGVPRRLSSKKMLHAFLWAAQADQSVEAMPPAQRREFENRQVFVLPSDDTQKSRTRMIQFDECVTRGDHETALEHGFRALELTPRDPVVLFRVGAVLAQRAYEWRFPGWQHHIERAIELLKESTEIDPTWDRAWVEIGIVIEHTGDWIAAREWSESIPEEVNTTPHLLKVKGFHQWMTCRFEDAHRTLQALIELVPEHADAHDAFAYCCFRLGDKRTGRRHAKLASHFGCMAAEDWLNAGGNSITPYRGIIPMLDGE